LRKKSKKVIVWMKVTNDKYELPVLVADSAPELAKMLGCSPNNICSSLSHAKHRRQNTTYRKVVINDDGGVNGAN
jgi:hypothetical protein